MRINDKFYKSFKLTDKLYKDFINLSKDKNPMHINSNYAIQHGFKDKIFHGNILNVFISYAIGELLPIKNIVLLDQSIKYIKPVYINMTVRLDLTIEQIIESVEIIKFDFLFFEKYSKQKIAKGKITIKKML